MQDVKDSRKRYSEVCTSLPFYFKHIYDKRNDKLRIYFLSCAFSSDTTLCYCDVSLNTIPSILPPISDSSQPHQAEDFSVNMQSSTDSSLDEFEHIPPRRTLNDSTNVGPRSIQVSYSDHQTDTTNEELDFFDENHVGSSLNQSPSFMSSSSSSSSDSELMTQMDTSTYQRVQVSSPVARQSDLPILHWKPLISMNCFAKDSDELNDSNGAQEDLLLQRKRILFTGIVSYDFNQSAARFVFTVKNTIFWFDDVEMKPLSNQVPEANQVETLERPLSSGHLPYTPRRLTTDVHFKTSAVMCPHNADVLVYVADGDLWMCHLILGKQTRLTQTEATVIVGSPSFVMQEEFSRFEGFWWRPPKVNGTFYF